MSDKSKEKEVVRRTRKSGRAEADGTSDLNFSRANYVALGAALVAILLGYLLLSRGSITAAPILLVIGYCVLVPYGLVSGRVGPTSGE